MAERNRRRDALEPGWRLKPYDPNDPFNNPGALGGGNYGMTPRQLALMARFGYGRPVTQTVDQGSYLPPTATPEQTLFAQPGYQPGGPGMLR